MTKYLRRGLLFAALLLTTALILTSCNVGVVYAESIEELEQNVIDIEAQIEQLYSIKKQLHITAELLRNNEQINNGADVLLGKKWEECDKLQTELSAEKEDLKERIHEVRLRQCKKRSFVGYFTLSHYCTCARCTSGTGITASGTEAVSGLTIAVDPSIIPLGTEVEIDGVVYIAHDTGGAIQGNRIDICVDTHEEAVEKGVIKDVPVYVYY